MAKVAVLGQGYVGLPIAMRAVEVGHAVVGYDTDESRVKRLAGRRVVRGRHALVDAGGCPVQRSLHARERAAGVRRLRRRGHHGAHAAARRHARSLLHRGCGAAARAATCDPGATVILESTTYPGHDRGARSARSSRRAPASLPGADFYLGYSPERIDPGNPTWNLENTPKVVSGIDAASLAAVQASTTRLVDTHRAGRAAPARPS